MSGPGSFTDTVYRSFDEFIVYRNGQTDLFQKIDFFDLLSLRFIKQILPGILKIVIRYITAKKNCKPFAEKKQRGRKNSGKKNPAAKTSGCPESRTKSAADKKTSEFRLRFRAGDKQAACLLKLTKHRQQRNGACISRIKWTITVTIIWKTPVF